MELKRFFNTIIRMFWLIILLGAAGGGLAAYITISSFVPMYQAETTIYAMGKSPTGNGTDGVNYQDIMVSRQLVQDYQQIITSKKVTALAVKLLNDTGVKDITEDELKGMVVVNWQRDSSIIGIGAINKDPEMSAEVSRAVSKAFVSAFQEITSNNIVGVLDEAKVPAFPLSNDNTKTIAVGALAGILLALAAIYVRELFDTTVRSVEDIEYSLKLNVVGIIPKYSAK